MKVQLDAWVAREEREDKKRKTDAAGARALDDLSRKLQTERQSMSALREGYERTKRTHERTKESQASTELKCKARVARFQKQHHNESVLRAELKARAKQKEAMLKECEAELRRVKAQNEHCRGAHRRLKSAHAQTVANFTSKVVQLERRLDEMSEENATLQLATQTMRDERDRALRELADPARDFEEEHRKRMQAEKELADNVAQLGAVTQDTMRGQRLLVEKDRLMAEAQGKLQELTKEFTNGKVGKGVRHGDAFRNLAMCYLAAGARQSKVVEYIRVACDCLGISYDALPTDSRTAIRAAEDDLGVLVNRQVAEQLSDEMSSDNAEERTKTFYTVMHDATTKYNEKVSVMGAEVLATTLNTDTGKVITKESFTMPMMQSTGGTADKEHDTLRQMFQAVGKCGGLTGEQISKMKTRCRGVASDGAANATKLSMLHQLEVLEAIAADPACKDMSEQEKRKAALVVMTTCDMHNLNNASKAICTAIDDYAAEMLHFTDVDRAAVEGCSAQVEFNGAEKGWSRYIYETWKHFMDSTPRVRRTKQFSIVARTKQADPFA